MRGGTDRESALYGVLSAFDFLGGAWLWETTIRQMHVILLPVFIHSHRIHDHYGFSILRFEFINQTQLSRSSVRPLYPFFDQ